MPQVRFARIGAALLVGCAAALTACADDPVAPADAATPLSSASAALRTRTYYIAADTVVWDYAPSGMNRISGHPFTAEEALFAEQDEEKTRIGRRYKKALYREYTDASFSTLKQIAPEWQHLGALGPLIRAQVGDTIRDSVTGAQVRGA